MPRQVVLALPFGGRWLVRNSPVLAPALPYLLGQASRLREGVEAVAGNHLVLALSGGGFAGLAHLRSGSFRVGVGDRVVTGQPVAECGNSGNSTQPHVHVQVTDRADLSVARGVPVAFRRFREWPRGGGPPRDHDAGVPGEGAVVERLGVEPLGEGR